MPKVYQKEGSLIPLPALPAFNPAAPGPWPSRGKFFAGRGVGGGVPRSSPAGKKFHSVLARFFQGKMPALKKSRLRPLTAGPGSAFNKNRREGRGKWLGFFYNEDKMHDINRKIKMTGLALCLINFLFLTWGCAPYVRTQDSGKIVVPKLTERKIFIHTDPRETEIGLIQKPLEEMLTSKDYKLLSSPDQSAYTIKLQCCEFELIGSFAKKGGSAAQLGTTAGVLSASSVAGVAGFGAASLLLGSSSSERYVGGVDVIISSPSSEDQEISFRAEAKISNQNQVPSARQAVAYTLAKKIAALMP